jgi:hypothetical protein
MTPSGLTMKPDPAPRNEFPSAAITVAARLLRLEAAEEFKERIVLVELRLWRCGTLVLPMTRMLTTAGPLCETILVKSGRPRRPDCRPPAPAVAATGAARRLDGRGCGGGARWRLALL